MKRSSDLLITLFLMSSLLTAAADEPLPSPQPQSQSQLKPMLKIDWSPGSICRRDFRTVMVGSLGTP